MTKTLRIALLAAAFGTASPALAQAVPAAKVAVVDLDRIGRECNACRTAATQLQAQVTALQTRSQQLQTSLQPEATALEAAVKALAGKQPDAALQRRIQTFQQNQANAANELQNQQVTIQRNQAFVSQQVQQKLQPLYAPAMTRRGANILVEEGQTLAHEGAIDITNDLLASLNAALPSLNVTAPPPQQQPAPAKPGR